MKPYASWDKKREHQTVHVGHPRYCGGCRRNVKIRVVSKKAVRAKAKKELEAA